MKHRLTALALALVMVLSLGCGSAFAADETAELTPMPAWSADVVADAYAMGLFGDEIYTVHSDTVTPEQLDVMVQVVSDKLALLGVETRPASDEALVIDSTRGGVVNAFYQAAAAYAFEGIDQAPEDYMVSLGVLRGDGTGLHLERECTTIEAAALAERLILALYDQQNAGSLGLLWEASNGEGSTLYLLGSIHTDRNNVYPFHKQLRDIITNAEQVTFELDFNDAGQIAEFAAMQTYTDGTTLADHISPELYQVVVDTAVSMGLSEDYIAQFKPWALASSFQSLALLDDETTGANAMAIDLYVNSKAVNAGIPIDAVETYAFQGGIFDTLSDEYQEAYLASGLLMCLDVDNMDESTREALTAVLGEEALEPATQEALDAEVALIGEWMDQWKARDCDGFALSYDKEAIINSGDELNSRLFTDRDPGMIQYAADYLSQDGQHTGLMVVGAGHMIGDTGIVQGLIDLGYDVHVVPVP